MADVPQCDMCDEPATVREVWSESEELWLCDKCSVPGVGEPLDQSNS